MPSEIDKMECRRVCPIKARIFMGEKTLILSLVYTFRLSHLETKVIEGVGKTPDIICDLHSQVESFKRKLEVRWGWLESNKTMTLSGSNCFFCAAECGTP